MDYLTKGEAKLLDRREAGLNLRGMAELLGVDLKKYIESERSQTPSRLLLQEQGTCEKCVIYRRRSKMTQDQVAKELGVSRGWVNSMERGRVPCDTLVWYWEA